MWIEAMAPGPEGDSRSTSPVGEGTKSGGGAGVSRTAMWQTAQWLSFFSGFSD